MCLGRSLIVMILSVGVGVAGCSRHEDGRSGKEQAVAACGASLLTSDNQSALRECDRATKLDPLNAGLWRNRGIALAGLQRQEESLASFDRAVGLAPQDPEAWSGKGSALASLGRYVDAIGCYDKALELKPNDELLSANKLATLVELTEKGGKAQMDALLSRPPATSAEWLNRGIVLVALERFPECAQSFAKLLESEPRSAIGWYGKGTCILHQNMTVAILPFTKEHSDVTHALENAISLAPSKDEPFVKEAKRLLGILERGESGRAGQTRPPR